MRFLRLLAALSAVFLFALPIGCGGSSDGGDGGDGSGAKAGGKLTLGAVLPTTGPNASVGKEAADATEMAVAEWAPKFAALGWELSARVEDDASDPKQAVSAAYAVTGEPAVFGVVAHYNSGCFLPASTIYNSAGTMAISPATTNVAITQQGYPEIARVTPHDGVQGELTATFARESLEVTRVAIIHDKTQYGQGLAEVFRDHGKTIGMDVISFDGVQVGDKDFKALLTKVRETEPDAIYFGGLYDEAGFLVKQMRELGMNATFISDDGAFGQDFFDVGGTATEGAVLSFPGTPIEHLEPAQAFLKAFEAKFGRKVQNFGPYAYDAANILLVSAMKAIQDGRTGDMRKAVVENARSIKHDGALGTTEFDDKGDTKTQQYSFYRAEAQKWVYLGTAIQGGGIKMAGDAAKDAKAGGGDAAQQNAAGGAAAGDSEAAPPK